MKSIRLLYIAAVSLATIGAALGNSFLFAHRQEPKTEDRRPKTEDIADTTQAEHPVPNTERRTPSIAPVELTMTAEKKVLQRDEQGHDRVLWRVLPAGASVLPGDVVRCTIAARNHTDHAIAHLEVTGPIATGMQYLGGSATALSDASAILTFSVNGGKTFSDAPTVETKLPDGSTVSQPAPESAFTHLHWRQQSELPAKGESRFIYRMRVR